MQQVILRSMLHGLRRLFVAIGITAILGMTAYGVYRGVFLLETNHGDYYLAYGLLLGAAALLVLLPQSFNLQVLCSHKLPTAVLLLATSIALQIRIAGKIIPERGLWTYHQVPLWLLSVLILALSGFVFDSRRVAQDRPKLFDRVDWIIAAFFLVISWYVRTFMSMSMAVDEGIHFSEMLTLYPGMSPWGVASTGYPFALHWLVHLLASNLYPLVDSLILVKGIASCLGAFSIATWYLVVRVFSPRPVAICASTLLVFLGWHWLNSRFIYLYPYDLAFISIATLCALISFERLTLGPAIVAGVITGFALLVQKCGVFLVPFLALVYLDYLIFAAHKPRKKLLLVGIVILTSCLFCYLPFFIANSGLLPSPRLASARESRATVLASFGMTETGAFLEMWRDAFRQLQIKMHDIPRHMFRYDRALLDPVFSGLFAIGLVAALLLFFSKREYRIQIIGFLAFIAPMAVSFPLDSGRPQGMSRRLIGTSFFVAWLAANGATIVASRVAHKKHTAALCIALAISSLLCNYYYLKTYYEKMSLETWYNDYGGKRAAMATFSRSLARNGLRVIVLDETNSSIGETSSDMPNLVLVKTVEGLRQTLEATPNVWTAVIVSWYWIMNPASSTAEQLSGFVPPISWIPIAADPRGIPMAGYGFIPPR